MKRIPIQDVPFQKLSLTLEGRTIDMTMRYGNLNDAWTYDLEEDGVELVRGQRVVLGTDLLRGHAWQIGGLVAIAQSDFGTDPAAGDFAERVSLYHLTEAEIAAGAA